MATLTPTGGVGNTPPLFAAAAKGSFTVIQGATYGEGDAIVVPKNSPATSVADLKGKTIAVAVSSSANYNLLAQLEAAGLSYDDVTIKEPQPADALAAFSRGHVDAWAIWEPFTSQAQLESKARVLVTGTKKADGEPIANGYSFQVASKTALGDPATKAAITDYVRRIAKAQRWSGTHQADWATVWAEETGLSRKITLQAVKKRTVRVVPIDQEVIDSEQRMADSFTDNELLPEKIDVTAFFSGAFNDTVGADGAGER